MRRFLLIIFAMIPIGVRAQKIDTTYKATDYSRVIIGNSFKGAVFSSDYNPKALSQMLSEDCRGRFTPSDKEILFVERAMSTYLSKREKDNNSKVVKKYLKKYLRQYFGYVNEKGERVIYLNCFGNKFDDDKEWLKSLVVIFDGGCTVGSANINLENGNISYFGCNGVA